MSDTSTDAGFLTPAVVAYGLPVVIVMLIVVAVAIAFLVHDYRRYSRRIDKLDAAAAARRSAMGRHPAGRHRRQLSPPDDWPTAVIPPVAHRPRHP